MAVSTTEEYIAAISEEGKQAVRDFTVFMNEVHPVWKNKISFSMPMWLKGEKMNEGYLAISAAKNHFSIHFSDEEYLEKLSKKLTSCKTGKRCINVQYGDEESYETVKKYVKEFMADDEKK